MQDVLEANVDKIGALGAFGIPIPGILRRTIGRARRLELLVRPHHLLFWDGARVERERVAWRARLEAPWAVGANVCQRVPFWAKTCDGDETQVPGFPSAFTALPERILCWAALFPWWRGRTSLLQINGCRARVMVLWQAEILGR